tara:strand:- start:310 stop:1122 length:813 start_codon:yes stop_codon:yes gene_type:complete
MATVNLGRIKPVFRGAYNNSTAYVIDDIVTSGNETFIAIAATQGNATTDASKWTKLAAKGADGTDVAATLQNKEIAFKTNAGALDGIPIGTAGQALKVNSGATGYEFGAVSGGLIKSTTYVNATRIVTGNSASGIIFDNIAVTKIKDASTSKMLVFGTIPTEPYAAYHSGLYFICKSTGMDNHTSHDSSAFHGIAQSYGSDANTPGIFGITKSFQDTTNFGAATHNFKLGWYLRDGTSGNRPAKIINYNNNDDARAQQSASVITFMEVLI